MNTDSEYTTTKREWFLYVLYPLTEIYSSYT